MYPAARTNVIYRFLAHTFWTLALIFLILNIYSYIFSSEWGSLIIIVMFMYFSGPAALLQSHCYCFWTMTLQQIQRDSSSKWFTFQPQNLSCLLIKPIKCCKCNKVAYPTFSFNWRFFLMFQNELFIFDEYW